MVISENIVNEVLNIVNVIPLTSRKPNRDIYPNEATIPSGNYGLTNESIALCHQIRTLDKRRLSNFYGDVTDQEKQKEIVEALCFQLAILPDSK